MLETGFTRVMRLNQNIICRGKKSRKTLWTLQSREYCRVRTILCGTVTMGILFHITFIHLTEMLIIIIINLQNAASKNTSQQMCTILRFLKKGDWKWVDGSAGVASLAFPSVCTVELTQRAKMFKVFLKHWHLKFVKSWESPSGSAALSFTQRLIRW